jgi:heme-binding protein
MQTTRAALLALLFARCSGPIVAPTEGGDPPPTDEATVAVRADYLARVKPIFAGSCVRCHGAGLALPWYHALPGVRGMIDRDVAKAQRNLDLSHDFPFRGRRTQLDYLDAIEGVLVDGSMPPLRCRMLHWGSGLNDSEKRTIREWIANARLLTSR